MGGDWARKGEFSDCIIRTRKGDSKIGNYVVMTAANVNRSTCSEFLILREYRVLMIA